MRLRAVFDSQCALVLPQHPSYHLPNYPCHLFPCKPPSLFSFTSTTLLPPPLSTAPHFPMEEWPPPADDTKDDVQTHTCRSETYVVQVPRDLIYRVPLRENAYISDRSHSPVRRKRCCCSCLWCFFLSIILVALVLVIIVGLFYLAVQPKTIKFSVERVMVNNPHSHYHHQNLPQYDITLKAENPNERMGVHYLRGGDALLSFKQKKIAAGETPAFRQEHENSTVVRLVLAGSNDGLPTEIQRDMEGQALKKAGIPLSLLINLPVRIKIGVVQTWSMNMALACNLRVNTLVNATRVLSQGCHTSVQL